MKRKLVKAITQSVLDCECKGDGYIFLKNGKDVKCPIHFECASNEEYRLILLRLEYQNMRNFVLNIKEKGIIDLNKPTTPQDVDEYMRANYDVETPESWVRAIQSYVREYLLDIEI
tara:strand:- start:86 stop:433 length:348 start_codon:yes stop_codon:yes gene_type:complete